MMPMEPHDDLLDPEWERPRRTSRLTVALVAALIFVCGFAGGVLTQRALTPDTPALVTSGPGGGGSGGGVRRTGPGAP
ncbi:hypothetical protein BJF90_10925 [Pseudonocardia sp. CNS-004]|nr:hypothetical protein BJF90_10925 [Pseudonocardia sp. CNS-004]